MNTKKTRFHQFIKLEKGPINTAIIDFLKGNLFQAENYILEAFERGEYENIEEFMQSAREEGLIAEMGAAAWLPEQTWIHTDYNEIPVVVEFEEGCDPERLRQKLRPFKISRMICYIDNPNTPDNPNSEDTRKEALFFQAEEYVRMTRDFSRCVESCRVTGEFYNIQEFAYGFNRIYNNCWGRKIAITASGDIKPCIHSHIIVGNMNNENMMALVEKLRTHWEMTKDKIQKCQDCELRFVCSDCRVIAAQQGGAPDAPHPCNYNPATGLWTE